MDRQIIAIGGGGFGREINELKIENYIIKQSNIKIHQFALYQLLRETIKII